MAVLLLFSFCRYSNFALFIQFSEINITTNGVSSFTKFLIHSYAYTLLPLLDTYRHLCILVWGLLRYLCAFACFFFSCLVLCFLFCLLLFFLFSMRRDCLFQYFVSSSQACVLYFPTCTGCSLFCFRYNRNGWPKNSNISTPSFLGPLIGNLVVFSYVDY